MKTINKISAIFIFTLSLFAFTSCTEDGDYNGKCFLEITFEGETKSEVIYIGSFGTEMDGYCFIQNSLDDFYITLTAYTNLDKLAATPVGDYRLSPENEWKNMDLDVVYIFEGEWNYCRDGKHTVTSISKDEDGVFVEGNFSGTLEDGRSLSGRYRFLVD